MTGQSEDEWNLTIIMMQRDSYLLRPRPEFVLRIHLLRTKFRMYEGILDFNQVGHTLSDNLSGIALG